MILHSRVIIITDLRWHLLLILTTSVSVLIQRYNAVAFHSSFAEEDDDVSC